MSEGEFRFAASPCGRSSIYLNVAERVIVSPSVDVHFDPKRSIEFVADSYLVAVQSIA